MLLPAREGDGEGAADCHQAAPVWERNPRSPPPPSNMQAYSPFSRIKNSAVFVHASVGSFMIGWWQCRYIHLESVCVFLTLFQSQQMRKVRQRIVSSSDKQQYSFERKKKKGKEAQKEVEKVELACSCHEL